MTIRKMRRINKAAYKSVVSGIFITS
jgi:hypothetical protein